MALAVVYFISVLMVSKYRDILEPQDERKQTQSIQSLKAPITGLHSLDFLHCYLGGNPTEYNGV